MTKEYLKMADVTFGEPVTESNGCIFGRDFVAGFHFKSTKHPAKAAHYVSHAINSHDELVAEVERLREMVCRMGIYLEMSGEYPEKESDNPVRQWLYDSIQVMASGIDD